MNTVILLLLWLSEKSINRIDWRLYFIWIELIPANRWLLRFLFINIPIMHFIIISEELLNSGCTVFVLQMRQIAVETQCSIEAWECNIIAVRCPVHINLIVHYKLVYWINPILHNFLNYIHLFHIINNDDASIIAT